MTYSTPRTLPELLAHAVALHAERPALGWADGDMLTYAGVGARVRALAAALAGEGLARGDRVVLLGENSPAWGIAYLAIASAGAVVVPVLPDFSATELANIFAHSQARAAYVSAKHRDKAAAAAESSGSRVRLLPLEPCADEPGPAPDASATPAAVSEEDTAAILYTSGTTGQSKGVELTHGNIVFDARMTLRLQPVFPDDRMLSILPLAHTYECTLGFLLPLLAGASVRYLERPPTPAVLLPALRQVRPTLVLSVPLVIEKIYRSRIQPKLARFPLGLLARLSPVRRLLHRAAGKKLMDTFGGELRFFGIGGAPLAHDVERFLGEAGFPYSIGYGLTETAPLIAGATPGRTRPGSTGIAIDGVEVRIAAPHPGATDGEIQVRGRNVMKGYYRDPERTAAAFTADGWLRTGDLGFLEDDGYLHIRGRLKNMLLGPSGENIYPEEIEELINEQPFVVESLVYEEDGRLVARVHLDREGLAEHYRHHLLHLRHEAQDLAARVEHALSELRAHVNRHLAAFSRVARFVEQPEPFEKTPTLKIKRYLYVAASEA